MKMRKAYESSNFQENLLFVCISMLSTTCWCVDSELVEMESILNIMHLNVELKWHQKANEKKGYVIPSRFHFENIQK